MLPEFIADENIDSNLIQFLRNKGFSIYSIQENNPGISDLEILEIANSKKNIILTEDKDFGEWVFAHKNLSSGIILLRYHFSKKGTIFNSLITVIEKFKFELFGKFVVITEIKLRIREI